MHAAQRSILRSVPELNGNLQLFGSYMYSDQESLLMNANLKSWNLKEALPHGSYKTIDKEQEILLETKVNQNVHMFQAAKQSEYLKLCKISESF